MANGDELLEAVSADTIAHEITRASKHSLPIGAPCLNCHTALAGPYCYACGQRGEKYTRSIWRLAGEAFEGLTDLDGRLWQTVPRLALRPGRLTRDYLDGHRAVQIPPFRIFLLVLVLVFFTGGLNFSRSHNNFNVLGLNDPKVATMMSPKDRADLAKALSQFKAVKTDGSPINLNIAPSQTPSQPPSQGKAVTTNNFDLNVGPAGSLNPGSTKASAFWIARAQKAINNPQALMAATAEWGNRFAVLALPIAALMLSVLFLFKKNVYVFDHLIFSMHSLSFQGLLLSAMFVGGIWVEQAWWGLWLCPVHLFFHMRGTYRSHILTTLIRMFVLFIGSSIAFAFLLTGLFLLGLATVQ
jgi:hypothetical protein